MGLSGIALGSTYPGNAFQVFQETLLGLRQRGVLAVASKNNSADVADPGTWYGMSSSLEILTYLRQFKIGILMPIDWSVVPKADLPPEVAQTYAAPSTGYALVMTYNTNLIKDPPKRWAEWWDTKKYDCPRVMRNVPIDNLEAAVLSAGVPADKVYPVDLNLAYQQAR